MRLFTGLDLPPHILSAIEQLLTRLKPLARISWSPVSNLHITTRFIGEWPESRLDELKRKLAFPHGPVPIAVEGLGFFPRIFWAGVKITPELVNLASATESTLEELGIVRESRPYSPHLTLARAPSPASFEPLRGHLPRASFGSFEAGEFHLYQSRNSVYTKLATFPLK